MATERTAELLAELVKNRVTHPVVKFIGAPPQGNPVYVMRKLDDLLNDLESLLRYENIEEAAEALARGCTWRDYDGKVWTK